MVQDNPLMNELEQLINYCRAHEEIYIFGHDLPQRLFSKYLAMSCLPVTGFLVPEVREEDMIGEPFPVINLMDYTPRPHFDRKKLRLLPKKVGILITVAENRYN